MITILTEPSPRKTYQLYRAIILLIKKYILKRGTPRYSGHFAVTRSLIEGFQKTGTPYVFNPRKESLITDHVHVLCGVNTLRYALKLKRRGRIKRLTAGPNIVVLSDDYKGLIGSPEIDFCVTPSAWVRDKYLIDNPSLEGRIGFFPAGVDADFWRIDKKTSPRLRLAFYRKRPEPNLYKKCMEIAQQNNCEVREIIYGRYNLESLKETLAESDFVIYFVEQEAQGIALTEIWATDTPTIVWNPGFWHHKLRNFTSSSAPYLTDKTGLFFRTAEDFEELFNERRFSPRNFQPRAWTLQHMTDEVCAMNFLRVVTATVERNKHEKAIHR